MSDLERRVKQSIDLGNPRAAIALAVVEVVAQLGQIVERLDRIAVVLERADETTAHINQPETIEDLKAVMEQYIRHGKQPGGEPS
jgi:hypothetical protein